MATLVDSHFLAFTALVTIDYQFLFFDITALLKFDKVTDFSGILILYCTLTFSLISKG
ncbi:hypothetical protein DEO72_LG9g665 [Vigna unguiculata]|uniref:Uncharacterized protein n=1 Tax=Vigna unguiculata TaxID=3917 RepID=A0A4D6MVY4_VIGUN|nr:hypothetical protein DEO72_LG9g665 [Vigna unguiculata]